MIGSIYHDYDSQQHKEIIQKVVGNFQNNFSALKQNKCGQIPLKKLIRLHATFFKATTSCLTVDNKKTHPPVFQPFVFPVYLRNHMRYNKSVNIFLHPFLKSFQLEQEFFKSGDKKS